MSTLFLLALLSSSFNVLKSDNNLRGNSRINIQNRSYYEGKFIDWLLLHNIVVNDGSHFIHLLNNFADNDDIITNHNSNENNTFELGHNQYSHMKFEYF